MDDLIQSLIDTFETQLGGETLGLRTYVFITDIIGVLETQAKIDLIKDIRAQSKRANDSARKAIFFIQAQTLDIELINLPEKTLPLETVIPSSNSRK